MELQPINSFFQNTSSGYFSRGLFFSDIQIQSVLFILFYFFLFLFKINNRKDNNQDTKTRLLTSFWQLYIVKLEYFTHCSTLDKHMSVRFFPNWKPQLPSSQKKISSNISKAFTIKSVVDNRSVVCKCYICCQSHSHEQNVETKSC